MLAEGGGIARSPPSLIYREVTTFKSAMSTPFPSAKTIPNASVTYPVEYCIRTSSETFWIA